ncbi:MAG: histidinol-phosphate transaminase [Candidatus Acidulodesulfobacterium sp.]
MTSFNIENFIKDSVRELKAYKVNEVDQHKKALKLDANESNYILGKNIKKKYADYIKDTLINLYPDPNSKNLLGSIQKFYGFSTNNFIFGNGSDELISIILLSLKKDVTVNIPSPSFSMYEIIAKYNDLNAKIIKLNDENFDLPDNIALIDDKKLKNLYFFSYPNNPTGNHFNRKIIYGLLENKNNLVVVDEAYIFFSDEKSFLNELTKYENLIVLKTFSKIGLAGLRFGMLFSGDKLIDEFKKIKLPYNINSLTLSSIEFFLKNFDEFEKNIKKTVKQRKVLYKKLSALPFIKVYNSDANFLLIKLKDKKNKIKFDNFLNENNIIIRSFTGIMDLYYRITVGTEKENKKLTDYFIEFSKGLS